MTVQPVTIGRGQPLAVADEMMREIGAHHLPVLEHGELVGVVSERDLRFLETIAAMDFKVDRVEDAMTQGAYAIGPDEPIENVAATMAERRLGCAVVVERGRVIGIFTTTDALDLIARGFLTKQARRS